MDISEIRKQHPEYNDMSDEQLARGLHGKFYSDMPFEDFSKKIGLQQEVNPNPSLMDVATGPATFGDWAQGRANAAKDLVSPDYWSEVLSDLTTSRPIQKLDKAPEFSFTPPPQFTEALGIVSSITPTTAMGATARNFLTDVLKPKAQQSVRDATFEAAGKLGYKVPRGYVQPGALANAGERIGGKHGIETALGESNKEITNQAARKALGLADDVPITPELLEGVRKSAGKAYQVIENMGPMTSDTIYTNALDKISRKYSGTNKSFPNLKGNEGASGYINALKEAVIDSKDGIRQVQTMRSEAKDLISYGNSAAEKALGRAKYEAANALDGLIERSARKVLSPDAFKEYRQARQLVAKSYAVESALNQATGDVSAAGLYAAMKHGNRLTGELRDAALFGGAVPRKVSEGALGGQPAGGWFLPVLSGGIGHSIGGNAGGLGLASVPVLGQPVARSLMGTNAGLRSSPSSLDSYRTQMLIRGLTPYDLLNKATDGN